MSKAFPLPVVCVLAALAALLGAPARVRGYSVLSHEAIIDSLWAREIRPLLLRRFPTATEAQLREAHAYSYGGCIIQDLGYYPFGNRFFSDLTHYVRTGDFVLALLHDARDINEYAFALGALSHYASDINGHPVAINRAVPIVYPKLRRKYGDRVTFEDDPKAHIMVEFSFDVVQVAASGYLPRTYHDFIGFKVSRNLLDRAFQETYGLNTSDVFSDEDLAIETYRRGASEIIPQLTRIAWKKRRNEILKADPQATRRAFVYRMSRKTYNQEWGRTYRKPNFYRWRARLRRAEPGLLARILVFLFQLLPKIGPLQTLAFKVPTPQADQYFAASYQDTLDRYSNELEQAAAGSLRLANEDLDTGGATARGEYRLADRAYANLLDQFAQHRFSGLPPALRDDMLRFYARPGPEAVSKKDAERRKKTEREVEELRNVAAPARAEDRRAPSLVVTPPMAKRTPDG
jgi:Zinc dependent phospholipase C